MKGKLRKLLLLFSTALLLAALCRIQRLSAAPAYHAMVLYNVISGEMGELKVYDTVPGDPATLSAKQDGAVFQLLPCAGLTAARDTGAHTVTVEVPDACFVLLDLSRHPLRVYPLRCGTFCCREYQVEISGAGPFYIKIRGGSVGKQ